MGIFDIKNTDIFSKDYDSANAWLEYNIFNECAKDENGESFDESDENNFWDYLKKNNKIISYKQRPQSDMLCGCFYVLFTHKDTRHNMRV